MTTPPGLGPHCVGQRVVVRRIVHGETGPTGGPAMTDLLGVMESWAEGTTTVRDESGAVAAIAIADIVSGKPVPPRPSVRHRVSAEAAERRAVQGWPPLVSRRLGEWVLRASGGYSSRANSVLAVGSAAMAFPEALSAVVEFYTGQGLPPQAQVVVGSEVHHAFEDAGWVSARPGEADTRFQLGSVAQALRAVRRTGPVAAPSVTVEPTAGPAWLADDERARSYGAAALRVLEGPDQVGFASMVVAGEVVAKGRVAYADDWAGISNVWVSPARRRQGLAVVVMGALLEWGAERGATTVYLQTRGDNPAALTLYDRLGFVTHHEYRYLTLSQAERPWSPSART
ncbi:MAG TPA: GNAT family N-acetyltransferase [Nocardioidaceae bacterium]|nr:GNAT family N-acetyltransferase [Nocardioidaceae bacterium]